MNWYIAVLKKYATFDGRARRTEYWMFVLFNVIFSFAFSFIDSLSGLASDKGYGPLSGLYALALLLPSLAVGVRRLHDTGRSGWWLLLSAVPLANIAVLVFLIQDGTRGGNQYGLDPKDVAAAYTSATAPAGWLPDPTGRHQLRYWDSVQWTASVSDNGVTGVDSL